MPFCIRLDTLGLLNPFIRSSVVAAWLSKLTDPKAKARVLARLGSATFGNAVIANLSKMVSPKCVSMLDRVTEFILRKGTTVYFLLNNGGKSSQKKDIARARTMTREMKEIG